MANFSLLFSSVLLAVFASSALAAPWPASSKHGTHSVRHVGRDLAVRLESYHPPSSFETFGARGLDHPHAKREGFDLKTAAMSYIQNKLALDNDTLHWHSGYAGPVSQHAFLKQQSNGIPFANAVANVAFNQDGKVSAFSSSFVQPSSIAPSTPSVTLDDAATTAEQLLDATRTNHTSTLEYLVLDDDTAVLTHVMQVRNEETGAWMEAFVDAHNNQVVSVTDFIAHATFRVVPATSQDPDAGFQTVVNPEIAAASPDGWNTLAGADTGTTSGNNVITFKTNQRTGVAKQTAAGQFVFNADDTLSPTLAENLNAALTNAFFIVNTVHDTAYLYGFTEAAFNFQNDNLGNGGKANDRVLVSVQDKSGTDNADFATPPDGQNGEMRMFLWDLTNPGRDGALENDVVAHEMTHGITNRMTGGGTGRCLQTTEAGGMGEGWSDAFAEWMEQTAAISDFAVGGYVSGEANGLRAFPYSTSAKVNPLTYSSIGDLSEVHSIGESWANMLHNVLATLVDAHGFATDALTNPDSTSGNVVFMHLFIDALAIQPCNPIFPTARDAIIQADANRFNGANECLLWTAFASRGLGLNAADHVDDFTVPANCQNGTTTTTGTTAGTGSTSTKGSTTTSAGTTTASKAAKGSGRNKNKSAGLSILDIFGGNARTQ
ncbi:Fungalysin metallopeptidase-domain-containing protein [Amylostereum chailletii]|nr:Fungalysin metallopeptidase-domain-containing protein [Amylostereum chailletii]